jgi:hypothetical protein
MNKQFSLRAIVIMIALVPTIIGIGITPILQKQQSAYAVVRTNVPGLGAPIATSGDNVYIA